ncbi:MAG: LegC family aminotransferase [Halobacteriovoraceae bacterium]|nr:LegC family aminotransferase [Halobacteriovoraceae bacterium]
MNSHFIPLSVPNLRGNVEKYLQECVETNFVSSAGPFVDKFENTFAEFVGTKHAIAVMNGTAALHLSLLTLGVEARDEVLTQNLTFIAPINAIKYCGADPVFFDSNKDDLSINIDQLEAWLENQTKRKEDGYYYNKNSGRRIKALLPIYIFGHVMDMERICSLTEKYNLSLIEDASEALGAQRISQYAGTFGHTGCFSFNGNKIATSGGGGMIVTNDDLLAKKLKHLSTTAKTDPVNFVHDEIGFNYRMVNLLAAVGLSQLECLSEFLKIKKENYFFYKDSFEGLNKAKFFVPREENFSNHWFYSLIFKEGCDLELSEVIQKYQENQIQVRPIWKPMSELPMFKNCEKADLSFSTDLAKRTINIPCSTNLTKEERVRVVQVTKEIFNS